MTKLPYKKPPTAIARELEEVADRARMFQQAVRDFNVPLPPEFPRSQLLAIAQALIDLPNGTAEGCRTPLWYARERLSAIRKSHFVQEDTAPGAADLDRAPPIKRESSLDEMLGRLMYSISTAISVVNELAADAAEEHDDIGARVTRLPNDPQIERTIAQAQKLDRELFGAYETTRDVTRDGSVAADNFQRQIMDAGGLSRLAQAELRMAEIVPRWCRRIGAAIEDYPNLLRTSARAIELSADVIETAVSRWNKLTDDLARITFKHLRLFANDIQIVADKLERQRVSGSHLFATGRQGVPPPGFDLEKVHEMLRRGETVPDAWLPWVTKLDLSGNWPSDDISVLRGLFALRNLNLSHTPINNIAHLPGLLALKKLNLNGTPIRDIRLLYNTTRLESLDLGETPIKDLWAISGLTQLRELYLSGTQVDELEPLSRLGNMKRLDLSGTSVWDLKPLSGLTNLTELYLSNTQVKELDGLERLDSLVRLDISGTRVKKLDPIADLIELSELYATGTSINDLRALANLRGLSRLDVRQTPIRSLSPLRFLENLSSVVVDGDRHAQLSSTLHERREIVIAG